jgi:predicted benzoate:H+ symporter BenE
MTRFSSAFHAFRRLPLAAVAAVAGIALLSACSPEVGSKEWCDALKEKPKGDWSANEAADFAKHCVL